MLEVLRYNSAQRRPNPLGPFLLTGRGENSGDQISSLQSPLKEFTCRAVMNFSCQHFQCKILGGSVSENLRDCVELVKPSFAALKPPLGSWRDCFGILLIVLIISFNCCKGMKGLNFHQNCLGSVSGLTLKGRLINQCSDKKDMVEFSWKKYS